MTNEGYQPSEPPGQKKRPGRPRKLNGPEKKKPGRPRKTALPAKKVARRADNLLDDTLAHYLSIVRTLEKVSKHGRNSIMHALVERFGSGG